MNPDGSGQHRVPNTDGGEYPSWSPDGKRVAFNSNLTGDHVMYIVDVDGSNLVDLSSVGEGWQVQWSPDGRFILFMSHRDHPDNYTDVYVMRGREDDSSKAIFGERDSRTSLMRRVMCFHRGTRWAAIPGATIFCIRV
jgi:Tol biopolymer transport system component